MQIKKYLYSDDKNLVKLKQISDKSGSKTIKETFAYLRFIFYHSKKENLLSEYIPQIAYYVATKSKKAIRIIDIAIVGEYQNRGIGSRLINRLVKIARAENKEKITLRTSTEETAFMFYQKLGFVETGLKGNDIEMELNL